MREVIDYFFERYLPLIANNPEKLDTFVLGGLLFTTQLATITDSESCVVADPNVCIFFCLLYAYVMI